MDTVKTNMFITRSGLQTHSGDRAEVTCMILYEVPLRQHVSYTIGNYAWLNM